MTIHAVLRKFAVLEYASVRRSMRNHDELTFRWNTCAALPSTVTDRSAKPTRLAPQQSGLNSLCKDPRFRSIAGFASGFRASITPRIVPLWQVPRRDTVGSTRLHGAGTLAIGPKIFQQLRLSGDCGYSLRGLRCPMVSPRAMLRATPLRRASAPSPPSPASLRAASARR